MTKDAFFELALSFPHTETTPHFETTGFKITGKRMFATYYEKAHTANIFLTPQEQIVFCNSEKTIFPVPNKWGEKGATTFDLNLLDEEIVKAALISAFEEVLNKSKK